jgi:ribonuclease HI
MFRAVSDGSVRHHTHGAFGWVLSSSTGERLAYGMGPASGRKPTSYRAEAYGLLSLMQFLSRVKEYSAMHEYWSGTIGTDSQSVLETLHGGHLDLQVVDTPVDLSRGRVVLEPLCPDWDVLIEIQDAMTHLLHVQLAHVKGHQDRDQSYERLNLMVGQLNVDADHKASAFQDTHGSARPLVPISSLTKAHLILLDGTVTGNYDKHLRHEATAKPLLEYIRRKNLWTQSVMDSIHWSAHGLALKRQTTRQTHMVKLLHEMLPTTGQANKFDHGKRQCPLCPSQTEDRDHILCC